MPKLGVSMTGDFKALDRFLRAVEALPDQAHVINDQLAEETLELVRECFETSTDPYGKRWAPLVLRSGQPGRDTGRMSQWQKRFVSGQGFYVESPAVYSQFFQLGTGIYGPRRREIVPVQARALRIPVAGGAIFARSVKGTPPRRMVPEGGQLPSKWRDRYIDTTNDVLAALFK